MTLLLYISTKLYKCDYILLYYSTVLSFTLYTTPIPIYIYRDLKCLPSMVTIAAMLSTESIFLRPNLRESTPATSFSTSSGKLAYVTI